MIRITQLIPFSCDRSRFPTMLDGGPRAGLNSLKTSQQDRRCPLAAFRDRATLVRFPIFATAMEPIFRSLIFLVLMSCHCVMAQSDATPMRPVDQDLIAAEHLLGAGKFADADTRGLRSPVS